MNGTDKDRADKHPDQSRQPSPENGDCWPDDWSRSGDACEVVPENHLPFCRHEVHVVTQLVTGHFCFVVESKNLLADPPTVRVVGDQVSDERTHGNQECQHQSSSEVVRGISDSGSGQVEKPYPDPVEAATR